MSQVIKLYCQNVMVKFIDRSLHAQDISTHVVSGARHMEVERDDQFLTVSFVGNSGLLKQLNFSLKEVREYVCDGIPSEAFLVTYIGKKSIEEG